jgi:flagellar operon protein
MTGPALIKAGFVGNPVEIDRLGLPTAPSATPAGKGDAADFRRALETAQGTPATVASHPPGIVSGLKFSQHAVDRMQARGIRFEPETLRMIEGAVDRARAKGSRDTLVLTDSSALVVSAKNNTVVTVMDRASMKESVFTNIDSTVFA